MPDYIDREEAIYRLSKWLEKASDTNNRGLYNFGEIAAYQTAVVEINSIPAVDVIPRRKACPYYVHNENDRGNDSLCGKAECEVEAVRPVARGKWETAMLDHEAFGERPRVSYCSVCNQIVTFRTFFCPNCGADMRGDEDEQAENP